MARVREALRRAGDWCTWTSHLPVPVVSGPSACGLLQRFTAMHAGGRTEDGIDAGGILGGPRGLLVRDGYAGYVHLVDALTTTSWTLVQDVVQVPELWSGLRSVHRRERFFGR